MLKHILKTTLFVLGVAGIAGAQAICPIDNKRMAPRALSSYEQLARLPLLEDGRIKPFDTYATHLLLQFSGKKHADGRSAVEWLAKVLFAPQHTLDEKIFLINSPDIAAALDIEPEKKRRYSFSQLQPQFQRLQELAQAAERIDQKERDVVETEIIRLFHNLRLYSELTLTFSLAFPHPEFSVRDPDLAAQLNISNPEQLSFVDIARRADQFQELMAPLARIPSEQWAEPQKNIVALVNALFSWSQIYTGLPLHLIPAYDARDLHWLSPWDAVAAGFHLPEGSAEITHL